MDITLPDSWCQPVVLIGFICIIVIFIGYILYAKHYRFVEVATLVTSTVILFNYFYSCKLYIGQNNPDIQNSQNK